MLKRVLAVAVCLLIVNVSLASIQITSIHGGVTIDGVVTSSNATSYATTQSYDGIYNFADASIDYTVGSDFLLMDGFAYERVIGDLGPDRDDFHVTAFFDVHFSLDSTWHFALSGALYPNADDDHPRAFVTLSGTNTIYSIGGFFYNEITINESGILTPGDYVFSVLLHPQITEGEAVLGYSESRADSLRLSLLPAVPEASGICTWSMLLTCSFTMLVRWRSKPAGTHRAK